MLNGNMKYVRNRSSRRRATTSGEHQPICRLDPADRYLYPLQVILDNDKIEKFLKRNQHSSCVQQLTLDQKNNLHQFRLRH